MVDFFSDWCGPCKAIAPFLVKMSEEFGEIEIVKINVDNSEMEEICTQQGRRFL